MYDPGPSELSPAVKRIAGAFRRYGWSSFYIQIVLAVVSMLVLAFSATLISQSTGGNEPRDNPGAGIGLTLAAIGLVMLYAGAYWAFRYTRLSRKLRSPLGDRPRPSDAMRALRIGLIINMVGMLLT
ncbi:MAG: DUF3611 family protein, partial [Cyanobacteria bacterium P01_A01_bin.135]